ncbi:hypothetical protein FQN49_001095 [Arthroderma sp. PD_2]|nr:hypothetical protein FQN49_001095 [Arthroderma sp. PD_2]
MTAQMNVLNGLPEEHVAAFETLSKLREEKGLLSRPTGIPDDEVNGLNDDTALLRFLRARKFDPNGAFKQFEQAITAHEKNHIYQLYNEIEVTAFESARAIYPHWTGRRAKNGLPVCMLDLAHLKATFSEYEKTRSAEAAGSWPEASITTAQGASVAHDSLIRFVFPLCTAMQDRPNPTTPIFSAIYIVDVSAFAIQVGWDSKNYVLDIGNLLMTGYAEVIDRILIVNAPSYFSMAWNIIKRWIDPGTANKVVIIKGSETLSTLSKIIDPENIPRSLGGGFEWANGKGPDIDRGIKEALEWLGEEELPLGPIKWVVDGAGRKTAVAVGAVDGTPRTKEIARLKGSGKDVKAPADPEKTAEIEVSQSTQVEVN